MSQGLDKLPQPVHENNDKAKKSSHHPMLLLVFLYEGLPDLASFVVHLGAHGVRSANHTRVFPANLAPGGLLVFYQPFLYQIVPICFISVQGRRRDATFEKSTLLCTVLSKFRLLLAN